MRAYQIADVCGIMSKDVLSYARDMGIAIRTPSDNVEPALAQTIIENLRTSLA